MKDILFIHGLFMNPRGWNRWIRVFEAKGRTCHAPGYPYHEGEPIPLRRSAPAAPGFLALDRATPTYWKFISRMAEPPIAIGHSMEGLIVQILLNNGPEQSPRSTR